MMFLMGFPGSVRATNVTLLEISFKFKAFLLLFCWFAYRCGFPECPHAIGSVRHKEQIPRFHDLNLTETDLCIRHRIRKLEQDHSKGR